jgi:WD40 repeat protein
MVGEANGGSVGSHSCVLAWRDVSSPTVDQGVLTGIAATSASDAWAIGAEGQRPLVEHWDGAAWSIVHIPAQVRSVADVAALSANDVWIVGMTKRGPVVLRFDGGNWTMTRPRGLYEAGSLAVASDSDAWIVGSRYEHSQYDSQIAHWDGTAWSLERTLPNTELTGVAASSHDAWVVGQSAESNAIVFHWKGTRWRESLVLRPGPPSDGEPDDEGFSDVVELSPSDVWAAGWYSVNEFLPPEGEWLMSHFDGKRWGIVPNSDAPNVLALALPAAGDVWTAESDHASWAGGSGNDSFPGTVSHRIGSTWQQADLGYGRRILGLTPAAGTTHGLWAVGQIGAGVTADGGDFPLESVPLIRRFDCWQTAPAPVAGPNPLIGGTNPTAQFDASGAKVVSVGGIWSATNGRRLSVLPGPGAVAFDPSGDRVVVASSDGTATVFDATTGRRVHVFAVRTPICSGGPCPLALDAVAFSPHGKLIATGGDDAIARIWDARTGRLLENLHGHASAVTSIAFAHDGSRLLTGSADGTARIWSTRGRLLHELDVGTQVTAAIFSPSGRYVLTTDTGWTAQLWDAHTGTLLQTLDGQGGEDWTAAFSPDEETVAIGGADGSARLWSIPDGRLRHHLRAGTGGVLSVAFDATGRRLATAGADGIARVWASRSGKLVATLPVETEALAGTSFNRAGTRLLVTDVTGTARLWSLSDDKLLATYPRTLKVDDAVFSPDGASIVTSGTDETARIWNTRDGTLERVLRGHFGDVSAVATNGRVVFTASADGTARVWNAGEGRLLRTVHLRATGRIGAVLAPDGAHYAVWDSAGVRLLGYGDAGVLHGATNVSSLAFSPDGRNVVTASETGASLWDASTGQRLRVLAASRSSYDRVAFTADGSRVVGAGDETTIWSSATGEKLRSFPAKYGTVSSDGSLVVGQTTLSDSLEIWDTATGHVISTLPTAADDGAAFSADNSLVAVADLETTGIWDTASGQLVATLPSHADVDSIAFSPDGKLLLTADADGNTRLWDVSTGDLVRMLPQ